MASTVGKDIGRKLSRVGTEIQRAQPAALNRAGMVSKQVVLAEIRKDTGDGTMSGVGKSGAKIGARYDVNGTQVSVKMTGRAAPILERGRQNLKRGDKPIVPKKRGGKKALMTPYGSGNDVGLRASVKPSKAPGKHTFEHSFEKAKPLAARVMRQPIVDAARRGMRS